VVMVGQVDLMDGSMGGKGKPSRAIPRPTGGEPAREPLRTFCKPSATTNGWVGLCALKEDYLNRNDSRLGGTKRARGAALPMAPLTLVPSEMEAFFNLMDVLYLPVEQVLTPGGMVPGRAINRAQMEKAAYGYTKSVACAF